MEQRSFAEDFVGDGWEPLPLVGIAMKRPAPAKAPVPEKSARPTLLGDSPKVEALPLGIKPTGRPADPMSCQQTVEELLETLNSELKGILRQTLQTKTLSEESAKRLRQHLTLEMMDGRNPFPLMKLFRHFLGDQVHRLLDESLEKMLDYYWEHWEVPPHMKPPTLPHSPPASFQLLDLQDDPLQKSPEEIPGVSKGENGEWRTTPDTIQWIRSMVYALSRSGEKEDRVPGFMQKMRGVFGTEVVDNVVSDVLNEQINKAPERFVAENNGTKTWEVSWQDRSQSELGRLAEELTFRDLPAVDVRAGLLILSDKTLDWTRRMVSQFLSKQMNPDFFLKKFHDISGDDGIRNVFSPEFHRWFQNEVNSAPEDWRPGQTLRLLAALNITPALFPTSTGLLPFPQQQWPPLEQNRRLPSLLGDVVRHPLQPGFRKNPSLLPAPGTPPPPPSQPPAANKPLLGNVPSPTAFPFGIVARM